MLYIMRIHYPCVPKNLKWLKRRELGLLRGFFLLLHVHWCGSRCTYSRFDLNMLKLNFCSLAFCSLEVESLKMCFPVSNLLHLHTQFWLSATQNSMNLWKQLHLCTHARVCAHTCMFKNIAKQVIFSCFAYGWDVKFMHCFYVIVGLRNDTGQISGWSLCFCLKFMFLPEERSRNKFSCITY